MRLPFISVIMTMMLSLAACSGGGGGGGTPYVPPAKGTLSLTVVDANTSLGIAGARVVVLDGDTGNPINVLTTDADGKVSKIYNTGPLQLKVSATGYGPSPAPGIPPLPVQIVKDQVTPITVSLFALPTADRGTITGQVTNSQGSPIAGALIVVTAADGTNISSIAGVDGSYALYNVPIGGAVLNTFYGGYNFDLDTSVSVAVDPAVTQWDIVAAGLATGQISGHVSFTSVSGDIIDVTLLHPVTREVLPGLRTFTDNGGSYVMNGVPNGTYEIIASLENDGYVMDPDTSVTQGIPEVTISNDAQTKDFKVTGSIVLTNPATSNYGVPVLSNLPTFTWVKDSSYASADDYVVEVIDESGNTVWGGFDALNNFAPLVTVAQTNNPSVIYNSTGTATVSPLEAGRYYQLRVYALVYDSTSTGYTLLSASETLDGIFKVDPTL